MAEKIIAVKEENFSRLIVQIGVDENKLSSLIKAMLVDLSLKGEKNILLDVTNAKQTDEEIIYSFLVGSRLCKEKKGSLVITGVNQKVKESITLAHLNGQFIIEDSLVDAAEHFLIEEEA